MFKLFPRHRHTISSAGLSGGATPALLAVGPWHAREFDVIRRELDGDDQWPAASSLAVAIERLAADHDPPEVILLAQPRTGIDDQRAVDRLLAVAPLTRIVAIAGSWCEGELRTGRPLAGALRLYWHEFTPWWRAALQRRAAGQAPHWSAPLEAPRFGDLLNDLAHPGEDPLQRSGSPALPQSPTTVAIDAPDYATYESIADALKPHGWHSEWRPRHRPQLHSHAPFHAAIWDGAQLNPAELVSLRHLAADLPVSRDPKSAQGSAPPTNAPSTNAPPPRRPSLIALLDYPRPEHIRLAHIAGATAILGKPYSINALTRALALDL